MKKIYTWLIALLLVNSAFGQGNFAVGSNVIGVGIGLGSSEGDFDGGSETPALSFQYERGMWDVGGPGVISLGGYLGFKNYSYDYFSYNSSWNYLIIGARSAYHFNMIESTKFDVYAGLMLGLRIISFDNDEPNYQFDYSDTDLVLWGFAGARYYFNENWAAYAELGNGIGILNLGVAYKF